MIRQYMKRLLAASLAAAVTLTALPAVMAAEEAASEQDGSAFINYINLLDFSENAEAQVIKKGEKYFDLFTSRDAAENWSVRAENSEAVLFTSTPGNNVTARLMFSVDLTKDHVLEWEMTSSSSNRRYTIQKDNQHIDTNRWTAPHQLALVGSSSGTTAHYILVVHGDPEGVNGSIDFYRDGVYQLNVAYAGQSVTLNHMVNTAATGVETTSVSMPFFADYIPAPAGEAAMQVVGEPTATEATVQFNTPIDPASLTNLTVNGAAVTGYEDVSKDYDAPNTYELTYSTAAGKIYTIQDGGVTSIKASDGTAEALNLRTVRTTAESYVPTAADKFEILDAGTYGVDVQLYDATADVSAIAADNGLTVASNEDVSAVYDAENVYRLRFSQAAAVDTTYTLSLGGVNRSFMLKAEDTGLAFTAESVMESQTEMKVTISGYEASSVGMSASVRLELDKNGRSEVYAEKITLAEGTTTVTIPVTGSGRFYVTVDALEQETAYTNNHLVLQDADATSITTSINEAQTGAAVLQLIDDNSLDEIFAFAPYDALPGTTENADAGKIAACDMVIKNRPAGGFGLISDFYEAIKKASVAVGFTAAVDVDEDVLLGYTKDYDSLIGFSDWDNYEDYLKADAAFQKKAIQKLANHPIDTYADLAKALAGGVVCEQVASAEHYSLIDGYLTKSNDLLALDFTEYNNYKAAVQQNMIPLTDNDLKTYMDLQNAFAAAVAAAKNAALNNNNNNNNNSNTGSTIGGGLGGYGGGYGGGGTTAVVDREETETPDTSVQQPAAAPTYFDDLAGYEWAETYINELYKRGIIAGKGDRSFAPGDSITRAEFAKLIVSAFRIADATYDGFADVTPEDWYYPYVGAAYNAGIIQGIGGGLFGANDVITRQDAAVIAWRTLGAEKREKELTFMDKAEIDDYALEAVTGLCDLGVLSGNDKGEFLPKNNLSRAEAAKIIYTLLEKGVE